MNTMNLNSTPPGFTPNSIHLVKCFNQFKSFQSVEPLQCSPSILPRNPKLLLHLNLPHSPRISNKSHQPLSNIFDIIVLMQELGIPLAGGIGIVTVKSTG